MNSLIHAEGPSRIETITLICRVNKCTSFYMIGISVMNE